MRARWRIGCLVALIAMAGEAHAGVEVRAAGARGVSPVMAAGDEIGGWLDGRQDVVVLDAADLPRSGSDYLHASAIALGAGALRRLDDAQLQALLEFVGYCGRAVFADIEPRAYRSIVRHAGCGGRFTAAVNGETATRAALDDLLAGAPLSLPDARALRELLEHSNPDLRLMGLFLGGFLSSFLVLTAVRPARVAALPFCVLAAVLPGLLWAGGSRSSFVTWAEARADDAIARYTRLDVAASLGRGDRKWAPAALARTPTSFDGSGVTLQWSEVPTERHLQWSAALLQELRLSSIGSFPLTRGLRAEAAEGVVRVCNSGDTPSAAGWLHWRGDTWRLPALAPAETWSTAKQATITERPPAIRLFERRSRSLSPSLLQPLEATDGGRTGQAWLVLSEPEGTRPCRG